MSRLPQFVFYRSLAIRPINEGPNQRWRARVSWAHCYREIHRFKWLQKAITDRGAWWKWG